MKRFLLTALTLLSLLLCLGSAALFVRSHIVTDWINRSDVRLVGRDLRMTDTSVHTGKGNVALDYIFDSMPLQPEESLAMFPSGTHWETHPPADPFFPTTGRFGFGFLSTETARDQALGEHRARHVAFPLWLPAVLFALPPALWLRRRIKRRARAGHCLRCGYDMRATPGRCPECGEGIWSS